MKKNIGILILLVFQTNYSQDISLEKSLFNVQTGILGIWGSNEVRLTNSIALRSEIGLEAGFFGGEVRDKNTFLLAPVIALEPRWYYNLEKRASKSKNIKNNGVSFVTAALNYYPDWFVISNNSNVIVYDQITIIPKWGIRRNIADSKFNYELGVGLGYRQTFLKKYGYLDNKGETALDLHIRIGYAF
ncbi:hypothetical protein [Flavobacterium sp.]|uniref:hypothetical protein n=1 Tax=Flavobacterium sp. TaxID=239 RepID=UPI00374D32B6